MPDSTQGHSIPDIERLLRAVEWRFLPEDRVSVAELERAEMRLACKIPQVLKDLYFLVGANERLRTACNEFYKPDALVLHEGNVVFCVENQEVVQWGFRCDEGASVDPPVYQQQLIHGADWNLESNSLVAFLLAQVCWQCVNGVLPYTRGGTIAVDDVANIAAQCEAVQGFDPDGVHGFDAFVCDGVLICVMKFQNELRVDWCGNDETQVERIEKQFRIDQRWSS